MKKLILTHLVAILWLSPGVFSLQKNVGSLTDSANIIADQPKFYINIQPGYSFAPGSLFKFYPDNITTISIQVTNDKPIKEVSNAG